MDFYPRPGQCQGSPLDLSPFADEVDYAFDFNGTSKGTFTFRGAYAGQGANPGCVLAADLKLGGPASPPPGPALSGTGGSGAGHGGCGLTGLETVFALGFLALHRRKA
jgi:hypothetical protein